MYLVAFMSEGLYQGYASIQLCNAYFVRNGADVHVRFAPPRCVARVIVLREHFWVHDRGTSATVLAYNWHCHFRAVVFT